MARAILLALAEEEMLARRTRLETRMLREESRPLLMSNKDFKKYYRFTKPQFRRLCEEVIPFLPRNQGSHTRSTAIKPEIMILAAVAFYAHGSYQKNVGVMYHLGISQPAISKCLQNVTQALNHQQMLQKYIRFPRTVEEREDIALGFMNKFGFPGVLGCIDGTHVAIIRPVDREEDYFNRKSYHSLNVLVVCDSDLIIRHVDASFGGAAHDSHIWNCCPLKTFMQTLHDQDESFWMLGDSAYALRPWMMTPILNAAPNTPEEHYTTMHCKTRNVVERCFGVLKTRWRCLLAHRVLHYQPIKAGLITNACVVLHNFIRDDTITIDHEEMHRDHVHQPPRLLIDGPAAVADDHRNALVNRLWQSRLMH